VADPGAFGVPGSALRRAAATVKPRHPPAGPPVDDYLAKLLLRGSRVQADVAARVVDGTLDLRIDEASQITLVFHDPGLAMLGKGLVTKGAQVKLGGLLFELVRVERTGKLLALVFEDAYVAKYRGLARPVSAVRGRVTRVDFVRRLVTEQRGVDYLAGVPTAAPVARDKAGRRQEPTDTMPGAQDLAPDARLTVKGVTATAEQRDFIARVLAQGVRLKVPRVALVAAVETIIVESNARNLPGGHASSVGLFQQQNFAPWNRRDRMNPEQAATSFYEQALIVYRLRPQAGPGEIAWRTQQPREDLRDEYAKRGDEAEAAVAAFTGTTGTEDDPGTVATGKYVFRRGGDPDATGKPEREDTWAATGRLAEEVQWRRFLVQRPGKRPTFVFAPDSWLIKGAPVTTIEPDTDGVLDVSYTWDVGLPVASATVRAAVDWWPAWPGNVVVLRGYGPADGRWLVAAITRPMFSSEATIELVSPRPQLPEPTGDSGGTAVGADAPGGDEVVDAAGGAKGIVDEAVRIAQEAGGASIAVLSAYRAGSITTRGSTSDHSSNDSTRAARDIWNTGQQSPTEALDAAVAAVSRAFGRSHTGKAAVVDTFTWQGWRVQLLYRTHVGGNHFNHLHVGCRRA
jgi:hypothetical protein